MVILLYATAGLLSGKPAVVFLMYKEYANYSLIPPLEITLHTGILTFQMRK